MTRKKSRKGLAAAAAAAIVLMCVLFPCCKFEPKGLNTAPVGLWFYKITTGSLQGLPNTNLYLQRFLTESEWKNVQSYTSEDNSYHDSWDEMTERFKNWNFSDDVIDNLQTEISFKGTAAYIYINIYSDYRWFRVEID